LCVVFLAPPLVFKGIVAILFMAGCREYGRISDLSGPGTTALLVLQAALFGLLFYLWETASSNASWLLTAACLAWLPMFMRLGTYRAGAAPDGRFRVLGFISAPIALTACWFALCWLHERPGGAMLVALLLLIIAASDTGAYFTGKQFGKRKLAPAISPNKTWEGVYGGMVLALLAAWIWANPVAGFDIPIWRLAVMTVATALASIGGDLYISLQKRTTGLDDAGRLFPGHGGVLDRYDSLLSGAPFFALAVAGLEA
jgi:phosphatidate cytidylyltransferase